MTSKDVDIASWPSNRLKNRCCSQTSQTSFSLQYFSERLEVFNRQEQVSTFADSDVPVLKPFRVIFLQRDPEAVHTCFEIQPGEERSN